MQPAVARTRWVVWLLAGAASLVTLVMAARFGDAVTNTELAGLPDAGPVAHWGLPVLRVANDLIGTIAVGLLVTAAFMVPGDGAAIGPTAFRLLRRGFWFAASWVVTASLVSVFTVADLLGQPLSRLSPSIVVSFATSVSQGQSLLVQSLFALTAAITARLTLTRFGAAVAGIAAVLAVVPPAFTGHAAAAGNHQTAVTSLAMHVLASSLWLGGLVALFAVRPTTLLPDVAARFSRLALGCWVAMAVSGVANAWVRLGSWDALVDSRYGWLIFGKLALLALLGFVGATHRRWSLTAMRAGDPHGFWRLAAGEIIAFGTAIGLAVALSRSPTPVPTNPTTFDPYTDLVGFPMPPRLTLARVFELPLPDLFFLTIAIVGAIAYLAGVRRMRALGERWPWHRTLSWLTGMVIFVAATNLGLARYATVLFSVHMAQHMVLSMVVPMLLVGAAPLTLALRALHHASDPHTRGPREWLLLFIHSGYVRALTHPAVALMLYVVGLYALYFSSLFTILMRYHLGHLAMVVHFVASGYLLFWVLVGIDPGRRRVPMPLLILTHFISMVFHAFFGVALLQAQDVIGARWFAPVHPTWAPSMLSDQHLGASIAWAFGEIPAAIVMIFLVFQWMRADEREQRRVDRAADRAAHDGVDDELARYNAFLQRANAAEQAQESRR